MMGTNKIIAAVIGLVAVCVASFVAVRQLARSERIDNPTIIAGESSQTVQSETPATVTSEVPTESTAAPTESTSVSISDSAFSTYDVSDISEIPTSIVSTSATTSTTVTSRVIPSGTTATTLTNLPVMDTTKDKNQQSQKTTDPYIQEAAKQDDGFLGYLYNETGNYYYTESDPWQRAFGFNAAYDFGAQFVFMFFDTARIKYTYDNKDWMVELWKGQYGGVFIGAEIGVYYKPTSRKVEHYDCASDDDAVYMEMALYRNGTEILSREYTRYWWCTGFVPGKLKKYSDRSELNLKARITLDNKRMLNAFITGLKTCKEYKFVEGKSYRVDGLDVFINW